MPTPNDYSRGTIGSDNTSDYAARSSQGVTGEFGPTRGQREDGRIDNEGNILPDPVRSKQFSSDVNGEPEALCQSTRADVQAHADINATYGLFQPNATLGSHPWLRDELSNATVREPGNAVPATDSKIPFKGK